MNTVRLKTTASKFLGQRYREEHVCSLGLTVGTPLVVKLAVLLKSVWYNMQD